MTAAGIAVIVPMKPLSSAKSRLSPALSADERSILSLSMLRRVLLAAGPPAERIWVVGGDDLVREVTASLGAEWTADHGAELNAALEVAFARAAREKLCAMYLPADLPLLDADDVRGMIEASRGGRALTLAPASRDGGTNGIIVPLGSRFRPALGQGSFERHRNQASRDGVEPVVFTSDGLGLDLDVPADLEALERLRPGRLRELLAISGENPTVGAAPDRKEHAQPCPRRHARAAMNEKLKLGVLLPTRGLLLDGGAGSDGVAQILNMARAVESAGLDSVWVGDSLTAKPRLEPLTTLAAVAAHTRRVRLGTAVMLAGLRHPVLLAHAAGTVDLISGGRLVLGIGVGGAFNEAQQREWRSVGVEPSQRAGRMEEVVGLLKRLTAGETVTHKGRHFALDAVQVQPASHNPGGVPVLIACHWRAGQDGQFKRSATLGDGYISISDYPDEYAKVTERVRHHAEAAGRDFDALEAAFYMTVNLQQDDRRAADEAERFLLLYYGANIWGDRWGPFGPPERTAERIQQYADAGAGTVIVRFASFEQERQLDTFLSEVVPLL